jgi:F-type H+-transporting ATPase subunit b
MRQVVPLSLFAVVAASPALAATGPFFSLRNTDFVVLLAFLVFIGILIYFGVPKLIAGALDKRAEQIRGELDEARLLREEAQQLLASYERKSREVTEQAERIVGHARDEAALAAEEAKVALQASLERRLKAAEEQIASAEAAAVNEVRDRAIQVAVAAAGDAVAEAMSAEQANALIESAIKDVESKLH